MEFSDVFPGKIYIFGDTKYNFVNFWGKTLGKGRENDVRTRDNVNIGSGCPAEGLLFRSLYEIIVSRHPRPPSALKRLPPSVHTRKAVLPLPSRAQVEIFDFRAGKVRKKRKQKYVRHPKLICIRNGKLKWER